MTDEIVREIEEDLRRDRLLDLWHEFGRHIVGVSVALAVFTFAVVFWQDRQKEHNATASADLLAASQAQAAGDAAKATALFQQAGKAGGKLSSVAKLREAEALEAQGKRQEAAAIYEKLYKDGADEANADMAGLRFALILSDDKRNEAKVEEILSDLSKHGSPFEFTARELKALQAMQQGKNQEARGLLSGLSSDEKAPASIRERAGVLLSSLPPPVK